MGSAVFKFLVMHEQTEGVEFTTSRWSPMASGLGASPAQSLPGEQRTQD